MKRFISAWIIISFTASLIVVPQKSHAQEQLNLPKPGTMVNLSSTYVPVLVKGLKVHPENPLLFDFILDTGKSGLPVNSPKFKSESEKLIKYFLASLTIKEDDLWVNLSPYEKDRMIPNELGKTELGRDMLAQDYILKQLTASLIYPEKQLGKEFWNRIYTKAQQMYGTAEVPVNTFNKVWIIADKAKVLERNNVAYVVGSHLKVMLEEDYMALDKHSAIKQVSNDNKIHTVASQIVREIIIPELEKEVNQGQNFAPLRQMFYSMILASWYKLALKDALLNQVYSNKGKTGGVLSDDPAVKERIYEQYLKAYKKGVFNYIKDDMDAVSKQPLPRKYFSGGERIFQIPPAKLIVREQNLQPGDNVPPDGDLAMATVNMTKKIQGFDGAMVSNVAALKNANFEELGGGYYLGNNDLIKLHNDGRVEVMYTNFLLKGENLADIKSLDVVTQVWKNPGKSLLIVFKDGKTKTLVGFLSDFIKKIPSASLKDSFVNNPFTEVIPGSGIYEVVGDNKKTIVVYRNDKILFIGTDNFAMEKRYSKNPRILGYEKDGILFQEGPLQYYIEGWNLRFKSLDALDEINMPVSKEQTYTEAPNASGFVMGGVNTNETIAKLTNLTGMSINEIEQRARPGTSSEAGFIDAKEKLVDVLKADNSFVRSLGLTHQQLAEPLFYAMNLLEQIEEKYGVGFSQESINFHYKGILYRANFVSYRGMQWSIFNDGVATNKDYVVTNMQNGASVKFSGMVPYYIWRYGFYEGHVRYRVDPRNIVHVFSPDKTIPTTVTPAKEPVKMNYKRVMTLADIDNRINEIPKVNRPDLGFYDPTGDGELPIVIERTRQTIAVTNLTAFTAFEGNLYVAHLDAERNNSPVFARVNARGEIIELGATELPPQVRKEFGVSDAAMKAMREAFVSPVIPPGGIDLNAKNMSLDIAGNGIEMKFDPAMVAEFQHGDFLGIVPVVIRITPITSALPILGLEVHSDKVLALK
ncbi:MAG: hypothetical protein HQL15_00455 [Candidatus Omnitrophica bacterium]|nr:hypothetical protein [Candidatus Omnitrophota bacterium]